MAGILAKDPFLLHNVRLAWCYHWQSEPGHRAAKTVCRRRRHYRPIRYVLLVIFLRQSARDHAQWAAANSWRSCANGSHSFLPRISHSTPAISLTGNGLQSFHSLVSTFCSFILLWCLNLPTLSLSCTRIQSYGFCSCIPSNVESKMFAIQGEKFKSLRFNLVTNFLPTYNSTEQL